MLDHHQGVPGRRFRRLGLVLFAVIAAGLAADAEAQVTGTLEVRMEKVPACSLSATALDFGSLGSLRGAPFSTTTVIVTCDSNRAYQVALNAGLHGTQGPTGRAMRHATDPSAFVPYQLYRDNAATQVWGDTGAGDTIAGAPVSATGTSGAQQFTVYSLIAVGASNPGPYPDGVYTDSVTITVVY